MSKKDKHETEGMQPAPKGRGRSKKLILIIAALVVCIAVAAGAVFFLKKNTPKIKYAEREYKNLDMPEEMIRYTFDVLPELYVEIAALNDEIDKMDSEIKRLEEIENKYPKQKKIPSSEKKNIERLKKTALSAITKIGKDVETAFVMSLVEDIKGKEYAGEKKAELLQTAKEALTQIRGPEPEKKDGGDQEPKGLLGKIKSIFKKKS